MTRRGLIAALLLYLYTVLLYGIAYSFTVHDWAIAMFDFAARSPKAYQVLSYGVFFCIMVIGVVLLYEILKSIFGQKPRPRQKL